MKLVMQRLSLVGMALAALGLVSSQASAASYNNILGFQTFETAVPGDNNSGINDTTVDSNSTYDATPFGSISSQNIARRLAAPSCGQATGVAGRSVGVEDGSSTALVRGRSPMHLVREVMTFIAWCSLEEVELASWPTTTENSSWCASG